MRTYATVVKNKIQNLIDNANQMTGASDTTLTAAFNRLLAAYGGGASTVNGVPRRYTVEAGASVNAGDFVEFIQKWGCARLGDTAGVVSAAALNDTKVLIAYYNATVDKYRALVIDVDGATVTTGTPIEISGPTSGSISVTTLNESKAVIAYTDASNHGTAEVLTVTGTTLTRGTPSVFSTATTYDTSVVALSASKVLATYRTSTSWGNYAMVLTIDGTTITNGTVQRFTTGVRWTKAVRLTENKALAVYDMYDWNYSTPQSVMARVVTIGDDGVTISMGSASTVHGYGVNQFEIAALTNDQVLVLFSDVNDSARPAAMLLNVNNTSVSKAVSTALGALTSTHLALVALGTRSALAISTGYNNLTYKSEVYELSVHAGTITKAQSVTLLDRSGAAGLTCANLVKQPQGSALFVGNIADSAINGLGYWGLTTGETITPAALNQPGGTRVRTATSNKYNVGVAKTSGAAGETVDVYRVI
jgi:hypothetical protein